MKEYLKPEIAVLSFETEAITMDGNASIIEGGVGNEGILP